MYTAPSVKPGRAFLYYDPICALDPTAQARWAIPAVRKAMIGKALERAGVPDGALV